MPYVPDRRPGLSADTVIPELTENRIAMSSTDWMSQCNQTVTNLSAALLLDFNIDGVDEFHETQRLLVYRLRLTVNRCHIP